jgi:hypothetical protein
MIQVVEECYLSSPNANDDRWGELKDTDEENI